MSRREKGSVLHDQELIAKRMVQLVTTGEIEAIDGSMTRVQADSICVHGDSPGAVEMAQIIRTTFEQTGITIKSFA